MAGNGSYGFSGDGGVATAASLNVPLNVTIDSHGNLFIVDTYNNCIRKVSPTGIITTVAGNGAYGFSGDGGVATAASLSNPYDITIDSKGNLFIADYANNRIRKVNPAGIITTVAGNGAGGFSGDGGAATAASLNLPIGVTTDPQGNLFIGDYANRRTRKINPLGIITTVAGNGAFGFSGDGGAATAASSGGFVGVTTDPQGNLFIADFYNNRIRKVAPLFPGFDLSDLLIPSSDSSQLYHFDGVGRHLRTLDSKTKTVLYSFTYDSKGLLIQITDGDGDITRIERDTAGNPTAIVSADNLRTTLTLDANGYLASIANPASETFRMTYTADGLLTTFTDPKGNASTMTYDALGRLIRDQNAAGGFWALSRTELAIAPNAGYEASMSSALNRTTTYRVENLSTGDQRRTNLYPDATQSISLIGKNGTTTTTASDGTVTTSVEGPDPRFGMQAPIIQSLNVKAPSGLTATANTTRSTILSNPTDPLSLVSETTTVAINGRSFTSVFDAATRQYTGTSAESRTSTTRIDLQGRPTFAQVSGVEALNYGYDARGRLQTVTQGTGADTRSLTYTYGPDGFVQRITDATTQATVYQRDAAGRVTQATLPDSSVVGFGYDANGNLASLTPPGKPAHGFAYTPVDLESQYTPPAIGLPTAQTQYAYNLDKQLTSVIRPDGASITVGYDSAGRSASVTPSAGAGSSVTYGYSAATGQINSVGNANVTLGYSFDGALLKQETFSGAITGSIARGYDIDFRTTQLTVNGTATAFAYDRDSLLTGVGAMTLTRASANGFLTGSTLGSVTTTQSYNAFGELASFTANSGATPLYTYTLTYDKLGRIVTQGEYVLPRMVVKTKGLAQQAGQRQGFPV